MKPRSWLLWAGVVAIAYVLKRHYSLAGADELRWILSPTASLVGGVARTSFAFETGVGFVSNPLRFVIAPSCAGVNFMIAAFATLALGLQRPLNPAVRVSMALLLAYVVTIAANSLRILCAIWLPPLLPLLAGTEGHRVLGIVVYVSSLYALFMCAQRIEEAAPNAL